MLSTPKTRCVLASLVATWLLATVAWSAEVTHDIYDKGPVSLLALSSWKDPKALAQLKELAQSGDGYAQSKLGWIYQYGLLGKPGVRPNIQQALLWYRKAVAKGDADGQYHLGWIYYYGEGVLLDRRQAVLLLRKSAEQGEARAQNMLANCYLTGQGIPANNEYAAAWYSKAAERGNSDSQFVMGLLFATGRGVEQNLTQSLKWLLIAKANGNDAAEKHLAESRSIYSNETTTQAQKLAADWWLEHQPKQR